MVQREPRQECSVRVKLDSDPVHKQKARARDSKALLVQIGTAEQQQHICMVFSVIILQKLCKLLQFL